MGGNGESWLLFRPVSCFYRSSSRSGEIGRRDASAGILVGESSNPVG